MATPYKIIGQEKKKRPKHLLGVYDIPDEAIWLAQDVATLEQMEAMLDRLQERSFVERGSADYETRLSEARKTMRRLAFVIGALKRVAEQNLAWDFLSGERIKPRPSRQTIADVWRILLDGFEAKTFSGAGFSSKDDGDKPRMAATPAEGTASKLGSGKCAGPTSASNSRVPM